MYGSDAQLSASQVLRTFHHDELYLFLGAAFSTVGLMSVAFAFLGRKVNPMLIWLALFAVVYGQRLWLQTELLALMVPASVFFATLRDVSNYLVPIPAFFYFDAAGFLGRSGRTIAISLSVPFLCLTAVTVVFGPLHALHLINNVIVIACLAALVIQSVNQVVVDRDFVIIRSGLMVFVAFALCDNIVGSFRPSPRVEPIGFAFFLGTLGYLAAKRTLDRDRQFGEIQRELEIARRIQTSILPSPYPQSAHFNVATRYLPMTSVAGDFYDFLVADEKQAGLLIADVSGHGVPAALIASMVKLAAATQHENVGDPATLLSGMNAVLCGNTQSQFVTAAYVHLDANSATLRYSAAAHPPMLLLRAGEVVEVVENGLMLAAFPFATYTTIEHPLVNGDRLVLYTDGILEAANSAGEEFGPHRLCGLLRERPVSSPQQTADYVISSVQSWSNSQSDDLTVLVCDYTDAPAPTGV